MLIDMALINNYRSFDDVLIADKSPHWTFSTTYLVLTYVIKKIPLSLTEKLEGRSAQVRHWFRPGWSRGFGTPPGGIC